MTQEIKPGGHMYLPTQNYIFKTNASQPKKCRILTSIRKQILIHQKKVFQKPYSISKDIEKKKKLKKKNKKKQNNKLGNLTNNLQSVKQCRGVFKW
jgi:hypothetical protein